MTTVARTAFEPDSHLVTDIHPSPNVNERRNVDRPSMLILHYTGLATVEHAIRILADPVCQVSCHYVVDEAGHVTQMVPEELRAWHAGASFWRNHTDLNSRSIGIEIQNPGHEAGYPDFPEPQMKVVTELSHDIVTRHAIRPDHVLAHSDIAPQRKNDPGEKFDWRRLWQAGVGLWVEPEPIGQATLPTGATMTRQDISAFQESLREYGYDCPVDGELGQLAVKVVIAFQRHFRPARVDGIIDHSSIETLRRLHAAHDAVAAG